MPRVTREQKAATRARILEMVGRALRERGIAATGLNDIMSAAGMTHGGFYRHFKSQDDLVAYGLSGAISGFTGTLEEAIEQFGGRKAVAAFVEEYLSEKHTRAIARGCPFAALAGETG